MLKIIMQSYLASRVLTPDKALVQFKKSLDLFLQGDSCSTPNQIFLIGAAGQYFYDQRYKLVVDAIKSLSSVATEKEQGNER